VAQDEQDDSMAAAPAAQDLPTYNTADSPYPTVDAPSIPQKPQIQLPPQQQQPPQNLGAVTHGGAIAYLADGILRGYVQGRNMVNAQQAMKLKRKSDDLQNSYNQDAQRLYQLASAGIPQNSDAFKSAQSAVNGSWGALQDFRGQLIDQQEGGKKKKGKGKDGQQLPPAAVLSNPASTPQEKAQALHQVSMQAGPPVLAQVARFYTPQAQQQRTNQGTAQGLQTDELQARSTISKLGPQIAQIQNKPQDQWADSEKQLVAQYKQAYDVVNPPKIKEPKPGDAVLVAADDVVGRIQADPKYKLTQQDHEMLRLGGFEKDATEKQWYNQKTGAVITVLDDGTVKVTKTGTGSGTGGAGGGKNNIEAVKARLKHEFPELSDEQIDSLASQKEFGATISHEGNLGELSHLKDPEKQQEFDSKVLKTAINNLRESSEYKGLADFDDALANIVGKDDDGEYHYRDTVEPPRKDGGYSGNLPLDDKKDSPVSLTKMERDLQRQIMNVLSDPKNGVIEKKDRGAALRRMKPILAKTAAPAGGGASPGSPQAAAAPSAAPASSPASQGGKSDEPRERKIYQHGQLHGTIKLTDAEAKQLADDADFKAQGGTIK
jgi:hypothetical protein